MRGALYYGRERVRVEDVPAPVPTAGEVLLKVAFCGICGSDLHEYYDGPVFIPTEAHPRTGHCAPGVFGHEFSGTVVDCGSDVDEVEIGQRAAVNPIMACGVCAFCQRGESHRCTDITILGNAGGPGGLAEYVCVPARRLVPLPDEVSLADGALVEPLAVAEHAVSHLGPVIPSAVLIVGAGPIGIAAALALQGRGVERIVFAELSELRRDAVVRLGFELLGLDAADVFPVVVECAGRDASFALATERLETGGTLLVVAMSAYPVAVSLNALNVKEARILGTHLYTQDDFRTVIDRLRTRPSGSGIWTRIVELDTIVEVLADLRAGSLIKALVRL